MHRPGHSAPLLLELDLTVALADPPPHQPLAKALSRGAPALREVVTGLHRAAKDPRVGGLIVRTGGPAQPLATAQELRDALAEFRSSGRPTLAWSETFGEFGQGTAAYLIATGCEQIWLQPSGEVGLTGLAVEGTFVRELFDRIGVRAEVSARKEYKNAPNMATERGYTAAHREAMTRLLESSLAEALADIAEARELDVETVRALVERAPLTAQAAQAAGLIDELGYRDQAYAAMLTRVPGAELRFLHRLGVRPAEKVKALRTRDKRHVALIDVAGGIRSGRSGRGPLGTASGSDTVCAALRAATEAADVAAVVLRVDSPGGSYIASDTIWRAAAALRPAGKPLVVSMGRVAASGGYFVAMGADRILAQPTTITGSIGVFGGKVVIADLLRRHGIDHDAISVGARARLNAPRKSFDPDELAALEEWLDRVYADFTGKVAAARNLSAEQIDAAARGRVWTGADARSQGLVDAFGGLPEAAAQARALAGLPAAAALRPLPLVKPLDRFARPKSSADPRAAALAAPGPLAAWASGWGSWAELAAGLGLPAIGPLALGEHALRG